MGGRNTLRPYNVSKIIYRFRIIFSQRAKRTLILAQKLISYEF